MDKLNRREFVKNAGGAALGLIGAAGLTGAVLSCAKPAVTVTKEVTVTSVASTSPTAVPWPYQKLDLAAVADRGYAGYASGGCMFAAFDSIIGALRDKVGSPYTTFPSAMMKYGSVGVAGWGTLCGALNGAAAAIYLVADPKNANPLINELFNWYGVTALPDYTPANSKITSLDASVADSQLCHESITRWCQASGEKTDSPLRAERCARLTASVARYTVDLLNKQADGTFKTAYKLPAAVASCLSCHGTGHVLSDVHVTNQTDCLSCHAGLTDTHFLTTK